MKNFNRIVPMLIGLLCFAAAELAGTASATEGIPYGQGLLWQVQKEGESPNYVFGTMHVTDGDVLWLPDPVWEAFDNSDRALFESLSRDTRARKMRRMMYLPEGQRLDKILDRKTYIKALRNAFHIGLPERRLRRLRPWALFFALGYSPRAEAERRREGMVFLDLGLQRLAHRRGKSVHGLEKLEDQLAFFTELSDADALAFARGLLGTTEDVDAKFQEMLDFYVSQDLDSLMEMIGDDLEGPAARLRERFIEMFINDRNQNMVDAMREHLDLGQAFVAVGAAHLPGEKGVLNLLAQQGYQLTRLH